MLWSRMWRKALGCQPVGQSFPPFTPPYEPCWAVLMTMIAIALWLFAIASCGLALFFQLRAKRYQRQSAALSQLTEQVKRREIGFAEADRRVEAILGRRARR